jgi:hypothetical protein
MDASAAIAHQQTTGRHRDQRAERIDAVRQRRTPR